MNNLCVALFFKFPPESLMEMTAITATVKSRESLVAFSSRQWDESRRGTQVMDHLYSSPEKKKSRTLSQFSVRTRARVLRDSKLKKTLTVCTAAAFIYTVIESARATHNLVLCFHSALTRFRRTGEAAHRSEEAARLRSPQRGRGRALAILKHIYIRPEKRYKRRSGNPLIRELWNRLIRIGELRRSSYFFELLIFSFLFSRRCEVRPVK